MATSGGDGETDEESSFVLAVLPPSAAEVGLGDFLPPRLLRFFLLPAAAPAVAGAPAVSTSSSEDPPALADAFLLSLGLEPAAAALLERRESLKYLRLIETAY